MAGDCIRCMVAGFSVCECGDNGHAFSLRAAKRWQKMAAEMQQDAVEPLTLDVLERAITGQRQEG